MIEILLRERSRPGARVLDVGSGDGATARRLAGLGYEAVGVDADRPRLIAAARSAARGTEASGAAGRPRPRFVCADAARLPFAGACFDAAVSCSVFEHLADPPTAFRESRRVLRPGGFILVNVPHRWGPREGHVPVWFVHWLPPGRLRRWLLDRCGRDGRKWDAYMAAIHYGSPASLRRELERAFERAEIVSLRRYDHPELLTTRAQRWVLALLRNPLTRPLGRLLVSAMGHVDGLGVAAPAAAGSTAAGSAGGAPSRGRAPGEGGGGG